jgi:acetyltransferase-like isoleucine patch superfamily enzyme
MQPPKDYFIFKKLIDEEKSSLNDYLYFFIRIPLDIIEWLIRYFPGPIGILLRRFYYKIILKKVGKNVIIDQGVYFHGNDIQLDDWCYIDKFCILTSVSKILIGKRVHIGVGTIIHAGLNSEIIIGDNAGIAARCCIYSASNTYRRNKRMSGPMAKSSEVSMRYGKVHIGEDCFVGVGSTIMPNVSIGYASIIEAGALIKKSLNEKSIFDSKGNFISKREFDKTKI